MTHPSIALVCLYIDSSPKKESSNMPGVEFSIRPAHGKCTHAVVHCYDLWTVHSTIKRRIEAGIFYRCSKRIGVEFRQASDPSINHPAD